MVVVNTRLVIPGKLDGIGWFSYQTFWRIARNNPDVDFRFIFDREPSRELNFPPNVKPVVLWPQARHPILYYWFFEKSVTKYLNQLKPDIFVSTDGFMSLKYKGRQIPVIHDLNFMHRPADLPFSTRWYYRYFFPRWAKTARRVATVSEYSKIDLMQTLGLSHEIIDVVHNGANEIFMPLDAETAKGVRNKFTGGKKYLVYVGSLHKRKNIGNTLVAFDRFKSTHVTDCRLVVVGNYLFGKNGIEKTLNALKYKQDVIFTGRLDNEDLALVVGASEALVLVSFFEGFGIPLIEAFNCDVPVITSNVTSLPEVAGDAGLIVNPHSVEEIAEAMKQIVSQPQLRESLVGKARIVRQKFSWEKTAELMWQSIKKGIEGS